MKCQVEVSDVEPGSEATGTPAYLRMEVRELLSRHPLFSSLPRDTIADMENACELVYLDGGTRILGAGEQLDALYGVLYGGLEVVAPGREGLDPVRELYRGQTLGVAALLTERRSPFDVFTIRDSTLVRLSRDRFVALTQRHPEVLLKFARLAGDRVYNALESFMGASTRATRASGANFALLPLSLDPTTLATKDLLVARARAQRGTTHVTAQLVDRALGQGAAVDQREDVRVTAWLSNVERVSEVMLYECDPRLPRWTSRCRRQADRLVIIARGGGSTASSAAATAWAHPEGLSRPIDVVLVHPRGTTLPSATSVWAKLEGLRAIHHVRAGDRDDVARAMRLIMGRPIGVVLSGGGARGIAHVGVLAAIAEAGIPVDYVCGTSMGSIFAAGLALGWSIERIRREVRHLFRVPFALYDFTVPISSLLAGRKLDRVLHGLFGEANIEDLWLPFFCVSTDLSQAKLVVHQRGSLWKSVRASSSIPGMFPPLPMDGRTLVDGGLIDNLPLGLLVDRCSGPIIAVDVFPYGDPNFQQPRGRIARVLRKLRSQVRGEPASPPLFDILVRSTLVGSKFRQSEMVMRTEQVLHLEPPVARFGVLEWRAHRALYEAGYQYARAQLAQHRSLFISGVA